MARGDVKEHLPLGLDPFCFRQFDDKTYAGTRLHNVDKREFLQKVNELVEASGEVQLFEGYAPFCRHIFVPNFVNAETAVLPITKENRHLLRSGYVRRRTEELSVLSRWFSKRNVSSQLQTAKYLDLILYSKEQIDKENAAMAKERPNEDGVDQPNEEGEKNDVEEKKGNKEEFLSPSSSSAAPRWLIISVKAQDELFELPMAPITMMRNTLITEGGSGVALDRQAYERSVEYWQSHAIVMENED